MHKWEHYFEVYERYLAGIRRSNPIILEIGVELGGSLEMWRDYFGPASRIYGIDINPSAKRHEDIATKVFIGDQRDRAFLRSVLHEIGTPDVVIDDGGHTANQQITAFEELSGDGRERHLSSRIPTRRCGADASWTGRTSRASCSSRVPSPRT